MNGDVSALAMSGTDLYAGGTFTTAGGITVNRIAKWNGTTWSALGTGMNGAVNALVASGTDLYAGGNFTTATNAGPTTVSANYIAKWNATDGWSALGLGMGGAVNALAWTGTDLYAGGNFTTPASYIAKWTPGSPGSWSALGTGMNGVVNALVLNWNGELYAGGAFTTAGATTVNNIAQWNGSTWAAFGSGVNGTVNALAVYDWTQLYVGGNFSTAGGAASPRAALCMLHTRVKADAILTSDAPAAGLNKMNLYYDNPWGFKNIQARVADNCTMTAKAYGPFLAAAGVDVGELVPPPKLPPFPELTKLPQGTTRVVVTATIKNSGENAWVDVNVYDIANNMSNFDPVMDILTIGENGEVRKAYTGIISPEHYVRVANGSPGLDRVSLMVNGRTFEIGALDPGQSVLVDVGSAMNEGDQNTIVALAYGAAGTRADIQIYDRAVGTPIKLASRVVPPALRVTRDGNQLVLTWQAPANFFNLESKTGLTAASLWKPVAATQTDADGMTTVRIDLAEGQTLFRLQQ